MALTPLAASLDGTLVLPDSEDFSRSRLFHGRSGDPAAVVHAAGVDDVAAAVIAARTEGLPVAVRSGGHGMWESLPGALVIDLSALDAVEPDEDPAPTAEGTCLVRIGGGATWGKVADELSHRGLAISSGDTRSVGVGGLTLGGGIGWLVRCWGLALDQLVGVQLVTAAGEVVEVSQGSHPDLFWGLRGGGGNFGVATRLDFLAHPLAGILHATLTLHPEDLAGHLRRFRDVMRAAPWELNGSLVRTPAFGPEMPSRTMIEVLWAGTDETAARAAFTPLLEMPGVLSAEVASAAYPDVLQEPPMPPPGVPLPTVVDDNGWFASLDDQVIDDMLSAADGAGAQMLLVRWLGGRFGEVGRDETAVAFRDAEAFAMTAALLPPGSPQAEVDALKTRLAPFVAHAAGAYGNFTNSVAPGLPNRMYPPPVLARLRALKQEWDPGNLFSRNHNLAAAG